MVDLGELVSEASKRTMNFLFGAQRLLIEEIAFVRNEMLDRMHMETHLFNEFLSKMAQAHSVNDIRMMYEACGVLVVFALATISLWPRYSHAGESPASHLRAAGRERETSLARQSPFLQRGEPRQFS
jgi:hypothetical protein